MPRSFITTEFNHVTKCPDCGNYVFFNDDDITNHSVGGMITKRTIECDTCEKELPLYPWRTI